ncbi:cellulase-like family protein [Agromyces atrinae]|uniref:Sugar-binding cellulase-like protein n=1 Tax=Agromyces atrinae TaxID=592376 RepID=A0A4Q2M7Y6_9MICO|nr:cellulase-like family protein [Agromyces atrinae]NYD67031.1 hypothetical protein [Agromyces atrinae]RXZ85240.1 hypothetical protein ESP50_16145 [Agromyces atrinae]RXZ85348.1 hypothetical protein ESP50_15550 [Agromyces atrinae]
MTRYLGSGYAVDDTSSLTGAIPSHLPSRLTVCLWDFSWYTRAGAGEPYADLDRALDETAARGYNAVRICAAPLLTYGGDELGLDDLAAALEIEGMGARADGGYFGDGTRWYDTPGGYTIDVRERLLSLIRGAHERGIVVVLASWEYQQSPAYAADPRWFRAIDAVPLDRRHRVLAEAFDRMLTAVEAEGLGDAIAFTELHNEIDFSILPGLEGDSPDGALASMEWLRAEHPGQLVTVSFGKPPHLAMHRVPAGPDVAQFHIYSYGVLDALQQRLDIRSEGTEGFPNAELRALQVADAPTFEAYGRPAAWKLDATVVTDQMFYGYDTIDAAAWDAWLDEHYPAFHEVMMREIESRVIAVAAWARWRGVPMVVGEGWIGYTPLRGRFEEGPRGRALAEHGIRTALEHGAWGVVACSNAAPHHPMWADVAWQRSINEEVLDV